MEETIFVAEDLAGMRRLLAGRMEAGLLVAFEDEHFQILLDKNFVTESLLECATMEALREPPDISPGLALAVLHTFKGGGRDNNGKSVGSSACAPTLLS